jgi:hypothetical protein
LSTLAVSFAFDNAPTDPAEVPFANSLLILTWSLPSSLPGFC